MPVNFKRKDYLERRKEWKRIRTAVAGQDAIRKGRTDFLPMMNPKDRSKSNLERYEALVAKANFSNVTGRTLEGLVGQVFAVDPVATLPEDFQYIQNDIDGSGVTATQQSKQALEYVLQFSRAGLLVDYPNVAEPATKEDAEKNGIRPRVLLYDPDAIINWRTTARNGRTLLSLVVIEESYEIPETDDGFCAETKTRYRVLRLTNDVYTQEIWTPTVDGGSYEKTEDYPVIDGEGNPFDEITFVFIGASANDCKLEKPLLLDICNLNIGHYVNSAVYEKNVWDLGHPQPWVSGMDKQYMDDFYPSGVIKFGTDHCINLPVGATFAIEQVQPNTLAKEAMADKERQMVALGAKIVEIQTTQKTATEAGIDSANNTSVLATAAKNVTAAYSKALRWAAKFANVEAADPEAEILFELNTDFAINRMSAADRAQLLKEWTTGAITDEEMRFSLCKSGVGYLSDEDWKDQRAAQDAKLLGMGMLPPGAQQLKAPPGQPGKEDPANPNPPAPKAPVA